MKKLFSVADAQAIGRRGGKRSGEVRRSRARERTTFRALIEQLIDQPSSSVDTQTRRQAITDQIFKLALSGDRWAVEWVAKMIGEQPRDRIEVSGVVDLVATIEAARARVKHAGSGTDTSE